uniref:UNC-45/Cro1/She4 central domain-containing protein n=1 Tax=Strigamia maritima TaxID=126957 RepID=T1IU20_STRMM
MATDELKILMQNLKLSVEKKDNEEASNEALFAVVQSLTHEGADRRTLTEQFVKNGITKHLITYLQQDYVPKSVQCKVAELVAELAKTDIARKPCCDPTLVSLLVELLLNKDAEVALQACRALGNICYENDQARMLVNEHRGTETLLQLLKNCLLDEFKGSEQLRVIATGFLLNLTNTYEITQEKVLDAGVIDILCEYLERYWQDEDLCTHVLLTVNCIADSELGRQKILATNMCTALIRLLSKRINAEVIDTILELLSNLAESGTLATNAMKFQLASSNLCPTLIHLIADRVGKTDEDSLSIIKTASELINLLLTGDDSMVHLYNDGQGSLYKETISWLQMSDEILQVAGALAIGNFARRDEHCRQMVEQGINDRLLTVLRKHNTADGDIRLQHAVLSALRNLAIPIVNKGPMISCGIVDVVLPMTTIQTFPVVFKLLGTLRMLIQNAIASRLGKDAKFLQRLIEWCNTDDHPGVKGATDLELVGVLGVTFYTTDSENDFQTAGIVDQANELLRGETNLPEVKANTLSLICALTKSAKIIDAIKNSNLPEIVKKLSSDSNSSVSDGANKVITLIESG